MKIFNTVQELWDHCTFCPVCQEHTRTVTMQVGPDDQFKLSSNIPYEKVGSKLKLYAQFEMERGSLDYVKGRCAATYIINCDNCTFELQVDDANKLADKVKKAYFYFYLHSTCTKCDSAYLNSSDVEFDLENKKVFHLQIEREGVYLQDKYHVSISHDQNILLVSKLEISQDGFRIDHEKVIELPFVNLDFTNIPKVINKIKTLILFS